MVNKGRGFVKWVKASHVNVGSRMQADQVLHHRRLLFFFSYSVICHCFGLAVNGYLSCDRSLENFRRFRIVRMIADQPGIAAETDECMVKHVSVAITH
jgi:hypothetical protein